MKTKRKPLSTLQAEQNALYAELRHQYFEMKHRIEVRQYGVENKTPHHMAHQQSSNNRIIWSRTL